MTAKYHSYCLLSNVTSKALSKQGKILLQIILLQLSNGHTLSRVFLRAVLSFSRPLAFLLASFCSVSMLASCLCRAATLSDRAVRSPCNFCTFWFSSCSDSCLCTNSCRGGGNGTSVYKYGKT